MLHESYSIYLIDSEIEPEYLAALRIIRELTGLSPIDARHAYYNRMPLLVKVVHSKEDADALSARLLEMNFSHEIRKRFYLSAST